MIILKKLYFEPDKIMDKQIDPIVFQSGMNFIIGEGSDVQNEEKKMNSVGKSLMVEAINFCLMKDLMHSRIGKIPIIVLNDNTLICLDLELENDKDIRPITIKRSRNPKNKIFIVEDEQEKEFDSLDDAKEYLEYLFFSNINSLQHPSLRSLLSILVRDEKTNYDDILKPYPGKSNFSDLIKPHLYLFGFDTSVIDEIRKSFESLEKIKKTILNLTNEFKLEGIKINEVKSFINELRSKVEKLDIAIDSLRPGEAAKQKRDELNSLLAEMDALITERATRDFVVEKIKRLPRVEKINVNEVRIIYNQFRLGLGDMVQKTFDQVIGFKNQIDNFQSNLMTKKLKELRSEIFDIDNRIDSIDNQIAKIYSNSNAKVVINDLKQAVREQKEKNDVLNKYSETYNILEDQAEKKKILNKKITELTEKISVAIFELDAIIRDFEDDLRMVHEYIAGNQICQFEISTTNKKEYVDFNYRVKLDGGSGTNRVRTLIYDFLLMLNKKISPRHFGFLIHDNIFASAGRDDLIKSLNYLFEQQKMGKKFQYILTINKDEFDSAINEFNFEYEELVRATFTRKDPFLKCEYSEQ